MLAFQADEALPFRLDTPTLSSTMNVRPNSIITIHLILPPPLPCATGIVEKGIVFFFGGELIRAQARSVVRQYALTHVNGVMARVLWLEMGRKLLERVKLPSMYSAHDS